MALVAANAALFPHTLVRMYGIELAASHVLVLHIVLDALSQQTRIDVSAHVGGALCGWMFARQWRDNHNFALFWS